ncbi:MAG: hypothetical protein ACRCX8_05470 [Sarcina sp.]
MANILNGRYEVYYDKNKTKLMAKIGFSNDICNGRLERFDLNGNMIYETTIEQAKIEGLLKIYKDSGLFINMLFRQDVVTVVIINSTYTYNINYDSDGLPNGVFEIKNGNMNVLLGDLSSGIFNRLSMYKIDGTKDSELQFENGELDLTNIYHIDMTRSISIDFDNGMKGPMDNFVSKLYYGLDMDLKYGHNILQQAGKDY